MLTSEIMRQVRLLEIRTRRSVSETFAGEYRSAFRGRGMEFDEVREYQPGDDVRDIDWNVTARAGKPYIKRFVEERELTVMLAVDLSASGSFGSRERSKSELAAELCCVLAFAAVGASDKVGAMIFTGEVELFVPPAKGRRHALRIVRDILAHEPRSRGTDIAGAAERLARALKKRAVVFLVSDFLDERLRERPLAPEPPARRRRRPHRGPPRARPPPRRHHRVRGRRDRPHRHRGHPFQIRPQALRRRRPRATRRRRDPSPPPRRRPGPRPHRRALHPRARRALPAKGAAAMTRAVAIPGMLLAAATLAFASAVTSTAESGPVALKLTLPGAPPTVVESFQLDVSLSSDAPVQFTTPDWDAAMPDELTVEDVSSPANDPTRENVHRWRLDLAALAPGEYTIAPITIEAVPENGGEPFSVTSEPLTITVESILAEGETDLADIKDPVAPPTDYGRVALYAAGAAALTGLAAGAIIGLARRKKIVREAPPAPPHARALAELDVLLGRDLLETGRFKPFFGELSGLLRRYIEARFNLHAPTQSSEEFLRDPRTSRMFSPEHDAMLRAFLGQADAVKFAEGLATKRDAREAAASVRRFIEETTPAASTEPTDMEDAA